MSARASTETLVTLASIDEASARIHSAIVGTPLLAVSIVEGIANAWVKPESLQRTGAFKIRGATNRIRRAMEVAPRPRRFVTASSGNHAQAVAVAARDVGVAAIIVMPETASELKLRRTREFGAEIIQHGRYADERKKLAREIASEPGSVYVDPTHDADVITGQGTIGLEIHRELPDADVVAVPIGGGGLISGIAAALKRKSPRCLVVGVEPAGSASMRASIAAGHPVALPHVTSVADGLLIREPGALPFMHVRALVDDIALVSEDEILDAMTIPAERVKLWSNRPAPWRWRQGSRGVCRCRARMRHGLSSS